MKCNFFNVNFQIDSDFDELLQKVLKKYHTDFENPDLLITIDKNDILFEKEQDANTINSSDDSAFVLTTLLRKIGENLPSFDAAILHSASFAVNGEGIAFSALSGTGKSTHMLKWRDMLGERFQIINGDKPFVRFIEDKLYIYASPWAGKEGLRADITVPLKHICQIVRSETNHTEQMSKQEGINLLLNQIYMPFDPMARIKTLQLINRIADSVTFWKISCNMDDDAAEVSYKAIFGE